MSKPIVIIDDRRPAPYVQRTEHREYRAPTDESVALLKEMEAAAEAKRVASIRLEGNTLKAVVQAFRSMADETVVWRAHIDINGKRLDIRHEGSQYDAPDKLVLGLRDAIAKAIADDIVDEALRSSDNLRALGVGKC